MSDQATFDDFASETETMTDGGDGFEVVLVFDDHEEIVATRPTRSEANGARADWTPDIGADEEPTGITVRKAGSDDDEPTFVTEGVTGTKLCSSCGDEIGARSGDRCADCTVDGFDPDAETVTDEWEGRTIYTSWGYGQTNVEFARIVDVSDSGKTVLAKRATAERVDGHKSSNTVAPTDETFGDEFRLHVRSSGGDPAFRGSYPYIDGEMDSGTRSGSLLPFDHAAGEGVHETATGYGH